jgi:hypothetical protein
MTTPKSPLGNDFPEIMQGLCTARGLQSRPGVMHPSTLELPGVGRKVFAADQT